MAGRERISWRAAEPALVVREQEAMAAVAPELGWLDDLPAGGWEGPVPQWTANRPAPAGLSNLLAGRRLRVRVEYAEGFPMVAPTLIPVDPEIPIERRLRHSWHVNGDGTLCLLRAPALWLPGATAADMVAKAGGWWIEYRLMEEQKISVMSESGIHNDPSFDVLIEEFA